MINLKTVLSRREFIRNACNFSALGLISMTGGCQRLPKAIKDRPVRRDLARLTAEDPVIVAFQRGIAAMKALPASDPRSWAHQAQIFLNQSARSNWYFLPWQRAYLFYFEKICRRLSGYPQFAIPYWNWRARAGIPAVFGGGQDNPLFNPTRTAAAGDLADSSFVGVAAMNNILNQTGFLAFGGGEASAQWAASTSGLLESNPYNGILGFVGGDMASLLPPLDPLFWSHQAMIDRCWVEWNLERRHANPGVPQWTNFRFSDFVDDQGNAAALTVQETVTLPIHAYGYDDVESGHVRPVLTSRSEVRALEEFAQKGAPPQPRFSHRFELQNQIVMDIGNSAGANIRIDLAPLKKLLETGGNRMLLSINDVEHTGRNDFFVRIFVNNPDAPPPASIEDLHYAGSFALPFGQEEGKARRGCPSFLVDITDTLRRLNRSGALAASREAGIQLAAVAYPHRTPHPQKLTISRMELDVLPNGQV